MTAPTEPLLHYLRRLTARSASDADSDAVLLERFVSRHDETAFTALLARHGPMVFGVCRRLLRDGHQAEDVFQATFLVLAQGRLAAPSEALASWLYATAHHLASAARRGESRRRQREARCLASAPPPPQADLLDDLSARELLLALDEEMARLPETYRLPLILCHLEGRTHEEAARLLGWTAGSVKGRLERGRKRLHARLSRRGLTLSAAVSLLAVSQTGAASTAMRLSSATLQAVLTFGAANTAASRRPCWPWWKQESQA